MIVNSNIVLTLSIFVLVRATIYGAPNLAGMSARVARSAIDTDLATIAPGVGAIHSAPVPLNSHSPALRFCIGHDLFHLGVRVAWSFHLSIL
jgi:hypothetical protein